jgi:hypothetical protein
MTCCLHSAFHKNFHVFWAGRSDKEGTFSQTERQTYRHTLKTDRRTHRRQTYRPKKKTKDRHTDTDTDTERLVQTGMEKEKGTQAD